MWIKGVPAPTEKHFDPGGKVLRRVRRWKANVTDVTRAISGRDVEAPAECDGQMGIVATDTALFLKGLGSRACGA